MSKVRVHELAKGLNLQSKELINIINGLGVEVKSHMSILEGKDLEIVIGHFRKIEAEKNKKNEKKVVKTENKSDEKKNNVSKERKDNFNKDNKNSKEGYKKDNKSFNKDNKGHKEGYNKDNKQNFSKDNKIFNKDKKGNYSKDNRNFGKDKKEGFNKDKKQNFNKDNKPFNKDKKEGFNKDNRNFGKDKKDFGRKFDDRKREFLDDVVEVVDPAIEKRDARKTHLQGQEKNKKNKSLNEHKMREDRNPNLILKPAKKKNKANHKTKSNSDLEFENKIENVGEIKIPESITVKDFSESLGINSSQVISKLIALGIMAGLNQEIDFDCASLIAEEFGKTVILETPEITEENEILSLDYEDKKEDLVTRPPVVTVMGHVDHGKTSLLDYIRKSRVTSQEAGGITQHIGAYTVNINNSKIVFLDTPGHEAFTAMRSRGAKVTDISILVVAADDGVMPQTIEAINHSKDAGVPIIVAINKIDKEGANPERVKTELADNGLLPEDWGGDVITIPVSAKTGEGIDELLEMVLMVAEVEELKANPNRMAIGTVIEAQLDKGRGPVATILVQKGTLNSGDIVISGTSTGRIRAMFDDKGKKIKKATPSTPAVILGLSEVPEAGSFIYAVKDEKTARGYAQRILNVQKENMIASGNKVSLDDLFDKIQDGNLKEIKIIIKTDVRGTVDAVKNSLEKLSNEEVKVNIIHGAVGGINESDVMLAAASNAIIIGFNVRPSQGAIDLSRHENVDIRTYRVIYDAIEDIKLAVKGMLAPTFVEEVIGRAEVRATFKVPGIGTVAGVYVLNGKVTRNAKVRLLRDGIILHEGEISSLKRFKDDAKELLTGYEGGLGIANYNDLKETDIIEAYIDKEVER
ncbi:translation initiation factor IF-2 [Parvimonas micra]|uniref:Translation initiation factor IF-2 n=1 Tax=Parvimonas micra TaxID=33033 RepID=A0A9X3HA88_9FIRM|nr:translation initiation factor IF-2 [Parvimonas micra]MCZ7407603.1 translation initiation factor IF-2 [Parvimonas micra]MCZ7408520.1 translation initiation factor IF-2 [Parvimonas micra]MCZ7410598.1 translation initiation factor IF-2 [Parvimonas micra]MCZ7412680.1 translation initiation factor IF-2 [Parvimonas micra]WBB36266.1 translation initiation factor IF-2 [Parvimonas micra]